MNVNAVLYWGIFVLNSKLCGLVPSKRFLRCLEAGGKGGRWTWLVRQHIPNLSWFNVDFDSFSAAKWSAWQLGHCKFMGPKEYLSTDLLLIKNHSYEAAISLPLLAMEKDGNWSPCRSSSSSSSRRRRRSTVSSVQRWWRRLWRGRCWIYIKVIIIFVALWLITCNISSGHVICNFLQSLLSMH